MQPKSNAGRLLVTGATGFLGFRVVAAMLELDLPTSILIHPDQSDKVAALAERVKVLHGDVWNRASLKGLSRGYLGVIHLVGSTKTDPARGLTYQQINLTSARNVIGMAVADGVPNCLLLSAAALPMTAPSEYLRSKREAEEYLHHSGLNGVIVRAPTLYPSGQFAPLLRLLSLVGVVPPSRWLVGRYMPLRVDVAARGLAAIAAELGQFAGQTLYANDLRRLARRQGRQRPLLIRPVMVQPSSPEDHLENVPFGWLPPTPPRRR
jgi:uncharacterized protein YbjT (DUF2867 family)